MPLNTTSQYRNHLFDPDMASSPNNVTALADHSDKNHSVSQLELATLARHCKAENERFVLRESCDTRYAYELFRRALVEQNESAWEHIYSMYQPLVGRWVRCNRAFGASGESIDSLVSMTFTRFWKAMLSKRFEEFPTLGSLLTYLRLCASCAVVDGGRSRMRAEQVTHMLPEGTQSSFVDQETVAATALQRVESEEFWRFVTARLRGDAEREVVLRFFVLEMKPGDIYDIRQDLFASVQDVYRVKRNVLVRLGRDNDLQEAAGNGTRIPQHQPVPLTSWHDDGQLPEAAAAMFARVFQQQTLSVSAHSVSLQVRRACGRWIALRRLHVGLTNAAVTAQTGLDVQTLLLLEAGVADITLVDDAAQERVARLLRGEQLLSIRIADVVALALGQQSPYHDEVMRQVQVEINRYSVSSSSSDLDLPAQDVIRNFA